MSCSGDLRRERREKPQQGQSHPTISGSRTRKEWRDRRSVSGAAEHSTDAQAAFSLARTPKQSKSCVVPLTSGPRWGFDDGH
jgi:hypothetical protein